MSHLILFTGIFFSLLTLIVAWLFYRAANRSKAVLYGIGVWIILQSLVGLSGFYQVPAAVPPRFIFLIGPAILLILFLFLTRGGKRFIDGIDLRRLTLLHTIRIPVEVTLYLLSIAGLIPGIMTFEGWNFDILSGASAPIIYWLVIVSKKAGPRWLLAWNIMCLALLVNIVVIALLAAATPFQKLAFDQPNVAITYFPFVLLPAVVVPIVLFAHLTAIRQLAAELKAGPKRTL